MPADIKVKICGLTQSADIPAAILAGAHYVGFVFFPRSPRHVTLPDAAFMAATVPEGICRVALTVDADDAALEQLVATVPLDMLQLHGRETPDRVAAIRARFGLPVMKAVGVTDEGDLAALDNYSQVADQLLVDAKPTQRDDLPGGNGLAFDWRLIANRRWQVPWMLAGGLTKHNVAQAVRVTGAQQVDVSSGVEAAPGDKDGALMREFVQAAQVTEPAQD